MKQELTTKKVRIEDNSVVIKKHIKDIEGGRTLDCSGVDLAVIQAGHVVIVSTDGTYKPMPIKNGAYDELPQNHKYVGVVYSAVETEKPAASIMTWGVVNEEAIPYPMTAIMAAFKVACPHIDFSKDEEA